MWIVTNDETGAVITGPAQEAPEAGAGQTLRRVPLGTVWNVERRAFVDAARWVTKPDFGDLWPAASIVQVMNTSDAELAAYWARLLLWEGPINLLDERVIAGIDRARTLNILTTAQADRIKAGLAPE
jgi:hypothetical protein